MLFQYHLIPEKSLKHGDKYIVTYGISAYQNAKRVAYIPCVSTRFWFVFSLCVKFTAYQLSSVHLKDVLEDVLSKPH